MWSFYEGCYSFMTDKNAALDGIMDGVGPLRETYYKKGTKTDDDLASNSAWVV